MKEAKETFYDLIVGIVIYTILACIIETIIVNNNLTFVLGTIYGAIISGFLAYHMFRSLNKTLDFDPSGAEKYARKMSALRMGIMTITIGVALFLSTIFNIIGVIIGMMALKLAAYLQPIIHCYTTKIYNKGR